MAPMRTPTRPQQEDWRSTQSIDAFAREHGLTVREVKQLLGSGHVPFIELAGQIRIVRKEVGRMKDEGSGL
jgi:hypothetical protein